MSLAAEKYVRLTTYTRDGRPKPLPVWIADVGEGRLGFTTSSTSWKVKRLRNDSRVALQPSNMKGEPTARSAEVTGTAVVADGTEADRVQGVIKGKYGIQYTMIMAMEKVRGMFSSADHGETVAVIITLD